MITADISCSKYIAASVFYPETVTFDQARESLNKIYQKYENQKLYKESVQALWRVEDKRLAIHMIQEERRIRIMYIQFQSDKSVMKNMLKSIGADTENLGDVCNE